MTINIITHLDQPPLPTRKLWKALLTIFNHYLVEELGSLRFQPEEHKVPEEVANALRLLDCWLDAAIDNAWVERQEVKE
jgi:hypothetical protein